MVYESYVTPSSEDDDDAPKSGSSKSRNLSGPAFRPVIIPRPPEHAAPPSPDSSPLRIPRLDEQLHAARAAAANKSEHAEDDEDDDDDDSSDTSARRNRNRPFKLPESDAPANTTGKKNTELHDEAKDKAEDHDQTAAETIVMDHASVVDVPLHGEAAERAVAYDHEHATDTEPDVDATTHHAVGTARTAAPTVVRPTIPRQRQPEFVRSPDDATDTEASFDDAPEPLLHTVPDGTTFAAPRAEYQPPQDIWNTDPQLNNPTAQYAYAYSGAPRSGGGLPPTGPPPESGGFAQPPEDEPPHFPPQHYRQDYATSGYERRETTTHHSREYNQPVETRDRRLVPYLVGGLLFERHFRRKADRNLEKRVTQLANRRHEDVLRTQQQFGRQQERLSNEQQRQTQEMHRQQQIAMAARERFASASQTLTYGGERPLPQPGQPGYRPVAPRPEQRQPSPAGAEQNIIPPEIAEQLQAANQNTQPRVHIEQDAWRRKVVDEHGREVAGAITYGEAFHQERQQELRANPAAGSRPRRQSADAASPTSKHMGGTALLSQHITPPQQAALPSGITTPALPAGASSHVDPQHQLAANNPGMGKNVTNPWFWFMLALIIAAFFTAAFI
jgi:hypothetical protein